VSHRGPMAMAIAVGFRAAQRLMLLSLLLAIAGGVAQGISIYSLARLVDSAVEGNSEVVTTWALALATLGAFSYVSNHLLALLGHRLTSHVNLFISADIASLVSSRPGIEHFEREDYLDRIELLVKNSHVLGEGPRHGLVLVQTVLRTLISIVVLVTVSPVLVLVMFCAAAPLVSARWAASLRQRTEEALVNKWRLAERLFELTSKPHSGLEIRTYGLAREMHTRVRSIHDSIVTATVRANVRAGLLTALGWIVYSATLAGAIAYTFVGATRDDYSVGAVLLTVQVGLQATYQVSGVADSVAQLLQVSRLLEHYRWLTGSSASETDAEQTGDRIDALHDGIVVDHVSFRYEGANVDAIDRIDVHLPAGAVVAIVGPNGSGKTTLVKLLTGMYRPDSGHIRVDGIELNSIPAHIWRRSLSAVFQESGRFELVAGHVVGIGDLGRLDDIERVEVAIRRAGAEKVVDELPSGLDTQLGRSFPNGVEPSGGQWQMLDVARSQMRQAPVLVALDEPTASLDASREDRLFRQLSTITKAAAEKSGTVTVLVSHRFTTVRSADLIIVMDQGRIEETGTHDELIAHRGAYSRAFERQARAYR